MRKISQKQPHQFIVRKLTGRVAIRDTGSGLEFVFAYLGFLIATDSGIRVASTQEVCLFCPNKQKKASGHLLFVSGLKALQVFAHQKEFDPSRRSFSKRLEKPSKLSIPNFQVALKELPAAWLVGTIFPNYGEERPFFFLKRTWPSPISLSEGFSLPGAAATLAEPRKQT